jgi:hypothetical protein
VSLNVLGSYTIGEVNVGLAAGLGLLYPLLNQFDLMLTGSFGLGALLGDISMQLSAALALQLDMAVQVSNPLAALLAAIQATAQLAAQLSATLALGLPTIQVAVSANFSAVAALSAKLGGLQLLLQLGLAVKIPVVDFIAQLDMSAGPVVALSFGTPGVDTLSGIGAAFQSRFNANLEGINPWDQVYGICLVTKAPRVWAAMGAMFMV